MQNYDVVLKGLLRNEAYSLFEQMGGMHVVRWLSGELPQVQNSRMDLLGETAGGALLHVELQSTNEPQMALRMAEYALRVYRLHRKFPRQIVLYVGEPPAAMPAGLLGDHFSSQYQLVDIRDLDAEKMLASEGLSDNVLAILGRVRDRRSFLRRILQHVSRRTGEQRALALMQLTILAGLRHLGEDIQEEAKQMPILSDILDHDLIGPAIRKGIAEGLQQGLQEGEQRGLEVGLERERELVQRLIAKRFGTIPEAVLGQLRALTLEDLEAVSLRLFEVQSFQDLFR